VSGVAWGDVGEVGMRKAEAPGLTGMLSHVAIG
jgi:hypothetical protein